MNDLRKLMDSLDANPFGLNEDNQAIRLAKGLLQKLADYGKNGLPEVYDSPEDYLYDMYPDLPWNTQGTSQAIKYMLAAPELTRINQDWIKNLGFNIKAELQDYLEFHDA